MNRVMRDVIKDSEGRYLTPDEGRKLLAEAMAIEGRLGLMRELEQRESEIARATVEEIARKYPKFAQERPGYREKCERDVSYVLRYCALAALQNDPEWLKDKLLYWLKTILRSMEFGDVIRSTYQGAQAHVSRLLSKPHAEELNKYLQLCVDTL